MTGRKNERLTINKEFESFDQFISEYVTNLSRSGAFIRTSSPLPVGTEVDLRFTVIMDDIETIEGVGRVVRVETNPSGMGVVFEKLSDYSSRLIEKLLTHRTSAAPDPSGEPTAPGAGSQVILPRQG